MSGRLRRAYRRHRIHVWAMVGVVVGFTAYGLATSSELAVPYAVIIVGGGLLVAAVEPDDGFSPLVLAGLTLWAIGHLAGGTIGIGDDRTLYNALLPGRLHFDNVVHFVGFGTAGLAWWEATRPWLRVPAVGHRVGIAVAVWLAGMGVGAVNEVAEFIATLLIDTNVGGYRNTGRDLIANLLGAALAALVAARRQPT